MPSDSYSELVILNFFWGDAPKPHSKSMLCMLAICLAQPSDWPNQCCVAKSVSTTHAQWPTYPFSLSIRP